MTRLVLGVIGHVDHGKTALVRALTGIDTDRLPEEKRRGISIALGFAHLEAGGVPVDLIDMPGHERFVRTMIAGATGIDAVLLVVAANEGIKPQTSEHVDIAGLLGLRAAVVAITKADLVSPVESELVAREAAALAASAGLAVGAPIRTSALTGEGVAALQTAIGALAADRHPPPADGVPFLPIDRAFSVAGHGTVVTGTLRGAPLGPGEELELLPERRPVRVRALQVHGERTAQALPGQRVAVNLRDLEAGAVPRGAALAQRGLLTPSAWLTVQLRAVEDAPPLPNTLQLQALFGTAEVPARLRLLDREVLAPGETGPAQLRLAAPVAVPAREHVVLRLPSPARTVAGGRIIEAETRRLRRHAPETLSRLEDLAAGSPETILVGEIERSAGAGTSLHALSRLTGLAPAKAADRLQPLPIVVGRTGLVVARDALERAADAVLAQLGRGGLGRDALVAALPDLGPPVLDAALTRLVASGAVQHAGGVFNIPRPEADRARASQEAQIAQALADALLRGGLAPPDPAALAPSHGHQRIVDRLVRQGLLVRAHDSGQKRDVLFHREAIERARRSLIPLLGAPPGLRTSEIGAALGISRKYSVPLLEYLDASGFTRRLGDRRVLASPR